MRIFVIHLSKATCVEWGLKERNIEALLQDLDKGKHPVEVFEAIYSKTKEGLHPLVSAHLSPFFIHPSIKTSVRKRLKTYLQACCYALKQMGMPMSLGELGCFASHYLLWQRCLDLQEPICVLEDDILLESHFFDSLENIEKHINSLHWVRLMHLFPEQIHATQTQTTKISTIPHPTWGSGTQGYIIDPTAAKAFIKASKHWVMPVDFVMENTYLHGVKNYVFKPFAISEHVENALKGNISRDRDVSYPLLLRIFRRLHPYYVRLAQKFRK
ncbi:glycosyltransferase family 25 protein [Helicobacter ailurogastricus]|uniref:glycosyltransferase family 25 protein n=1 Tax=Helicobacter ailurogastricus TaxID=1578720 RepID=UPI0022CC0A39|nr:glycosyltransferase family 25 protein [Helicobacter ailurogastricus]GLH57545.1 Lipooligosaccharide 5G8 epitope biosynthesis-associated protein Lex2B [Helicobacter ailurogastricus]GLH59673.1 Lipooligosaccharide 5G8 epitope biosynthesis-associated protein Lex2B [Helicobacter ailurogastricus]